MNLQAESPKHPDLYPRIIQASFWVSAILPAVKIISFLRYLVVGRILKLTLFGQLGIVLLITQMLESLTITGFESALIQKREDIKPFLNTAWVVGILRAFILYGILFFTAAIVRVPWVKVPPEQMETTVLIIRVLGVSFILQAFNNIGIIYFRKELQFKKVFIYQVLGTFASAVVTVLVVLKYPNVWAVVVGKLAGDLALLILSYVLHPFRPSWQFDKTCFFKMWKFGRWMLGSSILMFLRRHVDDLFVWILLGPVPLAFYQYACRFCDLPTTDLNNVLKQVIFPAFSKICHDRVRLSAAYIKSLRLTSFLTIFASAAVLLFCRDFIYFSLTEKWLPMVPAIQILTLRGFISYQGAVRMDLYKAIGQPWISTRFITARLLILLALIYPFTMRWNIVGTALAVIVAVALVEPFTTYTAYKILRCKIVRLLQPLLYIFIGGGSMWVVVLLVRHVASGQTALLRFAISVIMSTLAYLLTAGLIDRYFKLGVYKTIREHVVILWPLIQKKVIVIFKWTVGKRHKSR